MQNIISFNGVKPQSRLPPWHLLLTKGLCFDEKKRPQRQNNSWNKHIILAEIRYVNEFITSLMELSLTIIFLYNIFLKEGFHLSEIMCYIIVLLFHSYGGEYCIHAVMLVLLMIIDTYTSISEKNIFPKENIVA